MGLVRGFFFSFSQTVKVAFLVDNKLNRFEEGIEML